MRASEGAMRATRGVPTNDTLLRALRREPTPYTPVWLMRQAGRYLPEYNATRARAGSFLALAKTPSLAAEVTLQPLERFPLDAAIVFSDILTIPDAMGLGLSFSDGEGPRLAHTTADDAAIARLKVPDLANLAYVFDAIAEVKHALANRVPLIGFAGSPFTLACYMIEGVGGGEFEIARRMAYERPDLLAQLCEINARAVTGYLTAQIEAGADVVMLFDTWGGLLPAAAWRRFSLASMRAVLGGLPKATPAIVFTKGGGAWLDDLAASGAACVGIDWTVDLASARNGIGKRVAIQGNLDPLVLLTDPDTVARQTTDLIRAAGPAPGHVFNLGHGIRPGTPTENVAALIETVHRISARSQALA
jgi:uroporphyrinogen decarboxylase